MTRRHDGWWRWCRHSVASLDAWLMTAPRWSQYLALATTGIVMVCVSYAEVPRQYIDYSRSSLWRRVQQPATYGSDTIADMYEARVVLNDPRDMYTKAKVAQTPLEARTWSKEASAPYPPAVLLAQAALFALGDVIGIGFYGMNLGLASLFLSLSAWYFLQTRWYLFPVLYLNFSYIGHRFVYVQDGSYLVMLVVITIALLLARRQSHASHALVALAITMKVLPIYYIKYLPRLPRRIGGLFAAILLAGFVLPYVLLENYLYIYRFHSEVKGSWSTGAAAVAVAAAFTMLLWHAEARLHFDWEDRIGWSLVPLAILLGFQMNVARHLLIALLVPDKRGIRNIAAAVGLALHALFPSIALLGSVLPITTGLLVLALILSRPPVPTSS